MDRLADWIQGVEEFSDLSLEELEPPIRRVDEPRLATFLGDIEALIHLLAMIPDLLQLCRGDAEMSKKRGLAREFWRDRYVDWSREAEA